MDMELYELVKPWVELICGGYIVYSLLTCIGIKLHRSKSE